MNDPVLPLHPLRCLKYVTWAIVGALMVGVWVAFSVANDDLLMALGFTGAPLSAVAATLSVRCYAVRITRLIRLAHGMSPTQSAPRRFLRSVAD